jgi:biopolymer transport protein ExbD
MAMSASQEADAVMGDINMTPMVDVLLVLLIIFMIITPALLKGFAATLPQALNLKERKDMPQNTVVGLDVNGNLYLNKQPITADALPGQLRAEMQKHIAADEPQIMFVKADQNLTWDKVDAVLKIARQSDVPMAAVISEKAADPNKKAGD